MEPTSTTTIEISPTDFDRIKVYDPNKDVDLVLDGVLDVQLIDGMTLGANQDFYYTFEYSAINLGSMAGQFINAPANGDSVMQENGYNLVVDYAFYGINMHTSRSLTDFAFASKFLDGVIGGGSSAQLQVGDGNDLWLLPSPTTNPVKQRIEVILQTELSVTDPNNMEFYVDCQVFTGIPESGDVIQEIALFNRDTNVWEIIDTRSATGSDEGVNVVVTGDPQRFVHPGFGETAVKIKWATPSFSGASFTWRIDLDQAGWIVD